LPRLPLPFFSLPPSVSILSSPLASPSSSSSLSPRGGGSGSHSSSLPDNPQQRVRQPRLAESVKLKRKSYHDVGARTDSRPRLSTVIHMQPM
jgi:hypothetical protein